MDCRERERKRTNWESGLAGRQAGRMGETKNGMIQTSDLKCSINVSQSLLREAETKFK
jgi:hypothetical protein